MTTPDQNNSERGSIHSYNAFIERRLPLDISVSVGYAGTSTVDGYATRNLNYAESGGNAARQLFAQANTASINLYASSAKARYNSLQVGVNRPFKNGLMLKGAYTLSKAMNEVEDDGGGYTWPQPSQFSRNYALANSDRTHMLQMGFVYQLPFARNSSNLLALLVKDWQINGIASWLSGRPFTIGGDNGLLQQQGGRRRSISGTAKADSARPVQRAVVRPVAVFSAWQRVGQHGPQPVPRTADLESRCVGVPDDSTRPLPFGASSGVAERDEPPAVGQPGTGFTDPNFMRIRSYASGRQGTWRAPRTVQLGIRFVF